MENELNYLGKLPTLLFRRPACSRKTWRDFYARYFPELIKEDGFTVQSLKCLHHDDRKPSATVNVKSGFYVCHVCGSFSPYDAEAVENLGLKFENGNLVCDDSFRINIKLKDS